MTAYFIDISETSKYFIALHNHMQNFGGIPFFEMFIFFFCRRHGCLSVRNCWPYKYSYPQKRILRDEILMVIAIYNTQTELTSFPKKTSQNRKEWQCIIPGSNFPWVTILLFSLRKSIWTFCFSVTFFLTPTRVSWYEIPCGYVPVLTIHAELSLVWLSCCL